MEDTLETETRSMLATSKILSDAHGTLEQAVANVANFAVSPAAEKGSPAAVMPMDEATKFMENERTARNQLAEYLTRTADGAGGYTTAMNSIATIYDTHSRTSEERIRALLKADEGRVPIRGGFVDWSRGLQYQHDHPNDFKPTPAFTDPKAPGGN
jgi:hypothetical protein